MTAWNAPFGRLYGRIPAFPAKLCDGDRSVIPTPQSWFAVLMAARHVYHPWPEWGHCVTRLETLCDQYAGVINVSALGFPTRRDLLLRRPCRRQL